MRTNRYRQASDDLIRKCFFADWEITKVANFVKDYRERQRCAEVLLPHYRKIMRMFK